MNAVGYVEKEGKRKVAVSFPDDVFVKIDGYAKRQKLSFSKAVVDLVKVGIFDLEEAEEFDRGVV